MAYFNKYINFIIILFIWYGLKMEIYEEFLVFKLSFNDGEIFKNCD